jgi:hypothetical protein
MNNYTTNQGLCQGFFSNPAQVKPTIMPLCGKDVVVRDYDWLWKNVFVRGELNSVQGVQAMGKTFLLCALTSAVTNGGTIQGVNGHIERRVLYLSGDDSPMTITKRLTETFSANCENVFFQQKNTIPTIGSPEFSEYFAQVKPDLCIIDTLQHFLPPKTDMNSASSVTLALQPLKVLSEQENTATIVVQHVNKLSASGGGGDFSVNYGNGSSAINGFFRSVWTLGRLNEGNGKFSNIRALCPTKNNSVAEDLPAILFELSPEGFNWAGIDENLTANALYAPKNSVGRPKISRDTAKELILDSLENNPLPYQELYKIVVEDNGISPRTFRRAKDELGVISFKDNNVNMCSLGDL